MNIGPGREPAPVAGSGTQSVAESVDYSALYDAHPEYVARRAAGSIEQAQVDIEVRLFKLPGLVSVVPAGCSLRRVLEIGCATGELIAAMPAAQRVGFDISAENIAAARTRFPEVEFHCGDFRGTGLGGFDAVVLSDVLEHVPDDAEFLRDAAQLGELVLVNLPLEDNWLNSRRAYGPADVSGHLRRYSLVDGLALFERAGLEVLQQAQVWIHETPADAARRALRTERLGAAHTGGLPVQLAKRMVFGVAAAVPAFGRRLFASNLFAAARRRVEGAPGCPKLSRPPRGEDAAQRWPGGSIN